MNFPFVRRSALESVNGALRELDREYQNYRRRTASVQETACQRGRADAAMAFLPVYDNLLRALEQPCQDEAFLEGIRLTMRSLSSTLSALGITEIPALGETFDPTLHEALEHITDPSQGENTIIRVVLTGFRQGDAVLRHALVVVAN